MLATAQPSRLEADVGVAVNKGDGDDVVDPLLPSGVCCFMVGDSMTLLFKTRRDNRADMRFLSNENGDDDDDENDGSC